jgi:hypothetical protein
MISPDWPTSAEARVHKPMLESLLKPSTPAWDRSYAAEALAKMKGNPARR